MRPKLVFRVNRPLQYIALALIWSFCLSSQLANYEKDKASLAVSISLHIFENGFIQPGFDIWSAALLATGLVISKIY